MLSAWNNTWKTYNDLMNIIPIDIIYKKRINSKESRTNSYILGMLV